MPAGHYTLHAETTRLYMLKIVGQLSPEQVKALNLEVEHLTNESSESLLILTDASQAQTLTASARIHLIRLMSNEKLAAGAVYGASMIVRQMASVAMRIAGVAGRLRFFKDEAEARAWLEEQL